MTIKRIIAFLVDLITSAITATKAATPIPAYVPPATAAGAQTVTTPPTLQQKLVALIEHENGAEGPFLRTGGQIFQNTAAETAIVAELIVANANPALGLTVPLFAAWISNESRFSPRAINPNNQNAKPGDTPLAVFLRSDLGIAQVDGLEISGWPGMASLTWEQQQAKAFDPTWAIPAMAMVCVGLLEWAHKMQAGWNAGNSDPGPAPWGGDCRVLGVTAYNSGRTGALKVGASYGYGTNILSTAATFAAALGVPA